MRPRFQLLDEDLADRIITEAALVLAGVGVEVNDNGVRELLAAHGAEIGDRDGRVRLGETMVEAALDATPLSFSLYDLAGRESHRFDGARTHFTPGSAAIFDLRYETTPMGAVETSMLTSAAAEIGRRLGMPTQGYIALSDSKALDAQAGLETGIGATLAALAGIDNVSGPGMLDFESCQSLEKLVVDHEICKMADRLRAGIEPRDDFPAQPLIEELLAEKHLLIADHTRRHLRAELGFPGPVIDRTSRPRWLEEGGRTLGERAAAEVDRLLADAAPSPLDEDARRELEVIMAAAARTAGMDQLPAREA